MSEQLNPSSLAYVEALYEAYLTDPGSVDEHWRRLQRQQRHPGAVLALQQQGIR